MAELIEIPYDNGKALEREFIKKYSEVQLDIEIEKQESEDDGNNQRRFTQTGCQSN